MWLLVFISVLPVLLPQGRGGFATQTGSISSGASVDVEDVSFRPGVCGRWGAGWGWGVSYRLRLSRVKINVVNLINTKELISTQNT